MTGVQTCALPIYVDDRNENVMNALIDKVFGKLYADKGYISQTLFGRLWDKGQLIWETAEELDQKLAQRVRNIRKRRLISQEKLASLSGVSYGSIKRFEATGQISLISLTKIAMALDIADELRNIFTQVPYRDIQEVINERR